MNTLYVIRCACGRRYQVEGRNEDFACSCGIRYADIQIADGKFGFRAITWGVA